MKRIILSAVLFLLAVAVGATAQLTLNKICDEVNEQARVCLEAAERGDKQKMIEASEEFAEKWERLHDYFTLVTSESKMANMEENIPSLVRLAEMGAMDLYCEKCLKCINTVETLKRNEKITIGNIF